MVGTEWERGMVQNQNHSENSVRGLEALVTRLGSPDGMNMPSAMVLVSTSIAQRANLNAFRVTLHHSR